MLAKKKRAINIVKCYSYITEFLMYGYGGFFIYNLVSSPNSISIFFSFILNIALVMSCAFGCEESRKQMRKRPPKYRIAKTCLGAAICCLFTFATLYTIAAVAIFFSSNGNSDGFALALIIFIIASPHLLLGFIGLFVIKNFNLLLLPVTVRQGNAPQNPASTSLNYGGGINDDIGYNNNAGYAKAPEPYAHPQNQGMAKNPGMNYP